MIACWYAGGRPPAIFAIPRSIAAHTPYADQAVATIWSLIVAISLFIAVGPYS
jgi:hypothetical protein